MGSSYTLLSAVDVSKPIYQSLVRVEVQWSNGQRGWGSGVLVGANDVLTAGHLFGNAEHATINNIAIYPAYYYGASSGGVFNTKHWTSVGVPSGSSSIYASEVKGDLALVSLSQAIGLSRGYWNIGVDFMQGLATTAGYPGTLNGAPAVSSGWVDTLSFFQSGALDIRNLYSQPGSSGSPIYVLDAQQRPSVIGVLSTGDWAVNITDTPAGQFDLAWVTQQVSRNNLDAAKNLPSLSVTPGLIKLGHGITQLTLHYPVTMSDVLMVDTHLNSRLMSASGQVIGTKDLVIPAGARQTLIDLSAPLPGNDALVSANWSMVFSDVDNALFANNGSAALTQRVLLSVEGSTAFGQVGGSTLPESVVLSSNNDTYEGLEGDDKLTGGDGIDTAVYRSARKDYLLQRLGTQGDWQIGAISAVSVEARRDGTDTLVQFERLRFTDMQVALDLDGNAGKAVKLIGAVFGKELIKNKAYVGTALDLLDQGMSDAQIAMLALSVAKFTTKDQIVSGLWTHVVGTTPTNTDKAPFFALLDAGMSTGALVNLAAETAANAVQINLLGLTSTGVEYFPVGI